MLTSTSTAYSFSCPTYSISVAAYDYWLLTLDTASKRIGQWVANCLRRRYSRRNDSIEPCIY